MSTNLSAEKPGMDAYGPTILDLAAFTAGSRVALRLGAGIMDPTLYFDSDAAEELGRALIAYAVMARRNK